MPSVGKFLPTIKGQLRGFGPSKSIGSKDLSKIAKFEDLPKDFKFNRVASFRSMINLENDSSVYSRRYDGGHLIQYSGLGVGRVLLAPAKRTVILSLEMGEVVDRHKVETRTILDRINENIQSYQKLRAEGKP